MGKKTKVGKARKDKFYHLAKETGYRSRAAFKLIQLNKKYGFLNRSRVVIDLCAAPGGWMQVVAENCPVSSLIVGVDLVPIRPVKGCVSLQEDITTDKCRQSLRKALQTWQADCVLNDGAPNVGKNWNHDAYNQSELTLHALKLSTEFLRKGGWFVTKIFRSKDYFALNWVFQQLFKKVWATKPQASRNESAEMFVVCEGYVQPSRIDPKFLDPRHVFKDVDADTRPPALNLLHPEKKQRHREGYADGDYTLFHVLKASEFIRSEDFMQKLATSSMIELDEEAIAEHAATSTEIKECCQDIKVLGRKEIKALLSWRKTVLKSLLKAEKEEKEAARRQQMEEEEEEEEEESDHDEEEQELDEALAKAHEEDRLRTKRKKRKERKLLSKKRMRLDLKMDVPGDRLDYGDDAGVFSLAKIRTKQALEEVQEGDLSFMDGDIIEEDDDDDDKDARAVLRKRQRLMEAYDRDSRRQLDPCEFPSDEEGQEEPSLGDLEGVEEGDSEEEEEEERDMNPLVVEMESKASRQHARTSAWFSKGIFEGIETEGDEATEVQAMAEDYVKQGGSVLDKPKKVTFAKQTKQSNNDDESSDDDDDDDDWDDDDDSDFDDGVEEVKKPAPKSGAANSKGADKDDMEVVPVNHDDLKLNAVGLAMGTAMVRSKKRRREIIESGYHRYMRGEGEDLPDWFVQEERKHCQKQMPVTKEEVQEHMVKMRAIDARPIKKLAEAKARKKKKMVKRLEKARKKAEAIGDTVDVSEKEKMQQIKNIYKKAGLTKQKKAETTYVVAKKGIGRRVKRPQGIKGRFKVVDPRMKKDNRAEKAAGKNKGRGGGKHKKGGSSGGNRGKKMGKNAGGKKGRK